MPCLHAMRGLPELHLITTFHGWLAISTCHACMPCAACRPAAAAVALRPAPWSACPRHVCDTAPSRCALALQAKYDFVEEMYKWSGASSPATILDVGCGIGGTSRYLAAKFPQAQVQGVPASWLPALGSGLCGHTHALGGVAACNCPSLRAAATGRCIQACFSLPCLSGACPSPAMQASRCRPTR